jgi:cell wall-associated NlpC family hydrolase
MKLTFINRMWKTPVVQVLRSGDLVIKMNVKKLFSKTILLLALCPLIISGCKSTQILTDASSARNKPPVTGNVKERYAALLDIPKRQLKNEKLYKFIDEWMGVPYRLGGMNKDGVDCSGFTTLLEKEIFDSTLPRTARQMAENVKRKFEEDLKEGDLVFFDLSGQKFSHVGIYLRNNKFVHASTSKGVIISDLKDPWYYKYFSRCGSVRDKS